MSKGQSIVLDIYFLILNYNSYADTVTCVYSIDELDYYADKKHIVIVDNHSDDTSVELLRHDFEERKDIEIVLLDYNMGFSKANNHGYKLIKEKHLSCFVVVCNSDVIFLQKDFIYKTLEEYKNSKAYIIGPDVYCSKELASRRKGHQSPFFPYEYHKLYVSLFSRYCEEKIHMLHHERHHKAILFFWKLINALTYIEAITFLKNNYKFRREGVPLNGSCIILTPVFIDKEDNIFLPEVFFYGEELLLYKRLKKGGKKVIYNPALKVEHKQGMSTNSIRSTKRELFVFHNLLIGAKEFLNE